MKGKSKNITDFGRKIPESKIIYQEYTDITEQQPCRGCTKREDLVTNGFDPDEARRLVTE